MILKKLSPFLTGFALSKTIENIDAEISPACTDPDAACTRDCQVANQNCIIGCSGDVTCISNCNRSEAQCIGDCPCSSTNSVLVLSTYNQNNIPLIIGQDGSSNNALNFEYGDEVVAHNGCGATLFGQFWYFGGGTGSAESVNPYKKQLSKINGCKMERQPDMPFDFYKGSCNTFSEPTPRVLLCFDFIGDRDCHTFDGTSFEETASSKVSHRETFGMGNYKGQALVTGCGTGGACGLRTEIMDMDKMRWSDEDDYPYPETFFDYIYEYSMASTADAVYVIGGGPRWVQTIGEFRNYRWKNKGNLHRGRMAHASITVGSNIMVIGGSTEGSNTALETEIWNFDGDGSQLVVEPHLNGYFYGVGLYVVNANFCT